MNLDSAEFIRVGTSYYAIIERPTISKDTEKIMISWNKETIVNDLGKDYISAIKKYYGFCCIPQHINYEREVGDFYNIYHPLDSIKESIDREPGWTGPAFPRSSPWPTMAGSRPPPASCT